MSNIGINTTAAFNPSPQSMSDGAGNINNEGLKLDGPNDSASRQGKAGGILSRLSNSTRKMLETFGALAAAPLASFTISGGNMAPPSLGSRSHGNPVKSDDAPAAEDKDSKWRAKTPKEDTKDAPEAASLEDDKPQTPDEAFRADRARAKHASLMPGAATTAAADPVLPPGPAAAPPPPPPAAVAPPTVPVDTVAAAVPPAPAAPPPATAMGRYKSPEEINELAYTVGMNTIPSGRREELETIPVGNIMR